MGLCVILAPSIATDVRHKLLRLQSHTIIENGVLQDRSVVPRPIADEDGVLALLLRTFCCHHIGVSVECVFKRSGHGPEADGAAIAVNSECIMRPAA